MTQITPVWQLTEPTESPRGQEKSNNFTANTTSSVLVVPGVVSSGEKMLALSQNPVL